MTGPQDIPYGMRGEKRSAPREEWGVWWARQVHGGISRKARAPGGLVPLLGGSMCAVLQGKKGGRRRRLRAGREALTFQLSSIAVQTSQRNCWLLPSPPNAAHIGTASLHSTHVIAGQLPAQRCAGRHQAAAVAAIIVAGQVTVDGGQTATSATIVVALQREGRWREEGAG